MKERVLLVDDEPIIRKVLKKELEEAGYVVETAQDGLEAMEYIDAHKYDAVILDNNMPKKKGYEMISELKEKGIVVIFITAFASVTGAVEAMKLGADDYLTKPFHSEELIAKLRQYLAIYQKKKAHTFVEVPEATSNLIGNSPAMRRLLGQMDKVKDISSTVLLLGENGTGKSVVAKELHRMSRRSDEKFVHVDCASLPASLIESELFGHQKGAFTNAIETKRGKFEQAEQGTIFLDEISLLPLELQGTLLNVLQEKKFTRIGGERSYPVKARIIAATNEDLEEAVKKRTFREDLFYRLNVIKLEIPPLRHRREDIATLTDFFLKKHWRKFSMPQVEISTECLDCLLQYGWPGNVRELENVLEGMVALAEESVLTRENLPHRIRCDIITEEVIRAASPQREAPQTHVSSSQRNLKHKEYETILEVLERHDGHRQKSAEELGISRRALQYKLKRIREEYDINL